MNIAVITGASSGLGREYVKAVFRMYPALEEIWIIARRENKLFELKVELGDKIRIFPIDITDNFAVNQYSEMLKETNANVRLLINNAGFGKHGNFYEIPTEENCGMVRLNCEALTLMTSVTLPFMSAGAEIINTCSIAAFAPNIRMAVYCSTKAYVMSFSRALRGELKKRQINVLAVCPGPMNTEFLPVANIGKGASKAFDTLPRVKVREMAEKSLLASKRKKAVYTNKGFYKFYRFVAKILPTSFAMKMAKT
ncbi:MAG: SDR family NAD(P)-dependent oxidoreductase [Clostridia bacterium]|nr:SDR family NAD(P)-dependent oxidoreductase [Clostridia bacterium]